MEILQVSLLYLWESSPATHVHIRKTFNHLQKYWPEPLSELIAKFIIILINGHQKIPQSAKDKCIEILCNIHPYYSVLFQQSEEIKNNYISYFMAGACGFYNQHVVDKQKRIAREELAACFDNEIFLTSFDQCSREQGNPPDEENTILTDLYFGQYVSAYRLINLVIRPIINLGKAENIKDVLHSSLLFCWMTSTISLEQYQNYRQPCITKDLSIDAHVRKDFTYYYSTVIKESAESVCTYDVSNFYEAVRFEIEMMTPRIISGQYNVLKCGYCGNIYVDDSKEYRPEQTSYCQTECMRMSNLWKMKFQNCQEALKKMRQRKNRDKKNGIYNRSHYDNSMENGLGSFTYTYVKKRLRDSNIKEKDHDICFAILLGFFDYTETENETIYYRFRPLICQFLKADINFQDVYNGSLDDLRKYILKPHNESPDKSTDDLIKYENIEKAAIAKNYYTSVRKKGGDYLWKIIGIADTSEFFNLN